ncbi:peptidoglycan editing factor PgeF [Alteromonas pelagimontana]|uniref:Purine nucleoside phosphorylase n=1 Tax=Alteromonas pelagimontana TaxID=1858656 RepID=A0A6M4MGV1_9ALTE|nr:peptidoglycan editing factor PgeF [Alteromonas pelagimontana]QJR82128.1 peptidoglycan editing factor PgeF [Alteromonas pelagimontana]
MLSLIRPHWPAPKHIVAYTTTRQGGVSTGKYSGLNVGLHVGDVPEHVISNRALLPDSEKIWWLEQVHGNQCVRLPQLRKEGTFAADASVTQAQDVFCAVMTADCVPLLLCDQNGQEVAAIHAGWQGLVNGIIENTIAEMRTAPEQMMAWVGPAISQRHYQVGHETAERFSRWPGFQTNADEDGRCYLDLPAVAESILSTLGIGWIGRSELCTYSDSTRFYSHRFAQHAGRSATGRMVSVIGITS